MRSENPPITNMIDLLEILYNHPLFGDHRKVKAVLHFNRIIGNEKWYVREHFDDGKGHSGAFTSDVTFVAKEVAEEARKQSFVDGVPHWGYTAKDEFRINRHGIEELHHLHYLKVEKNKRKNGE